MKKLLTLILTLLFIVLLPAASAEGASLTVVNCENWVSLRQHADEDASRLAKIPLGAGVQDAEFAENGFIRCRYDGMTGYVLAAYLSPASGSLFAQAMQVVNCESWVSLRASASTAAARLAQVPLNAVVTDCSFAGSAFVRCTYEGKTGYILVDHLAVTAAPEAAEAPAGQILFETAPAIAAQEDDAGMNGSAIEPVGSIAVEADDLGKQMQIANCETWVSLRSDTNTGAYRRAKVPLGAIVTHCEDAGNGFTRCRYHGYEGYVLSEYLAPLGTVKFSFAEMQTYGREVVSQPVGDHTFIARLAFDDLETLRIGMYDANKQPLWSCATACEAGMQLISTDAFVAGTADHPMIALYNCAPSTPGLIYDVMQMLDAGDGHIIWSRIAAKVGLSGGGICHAVDAEGNMYIGGYFGPDPVCISRDGELLWISSANDDDIFWLYEIEVTEGGILARYESGPDGEMAGDNYWEVFYKVDPQAIAEDPFITPSRVESKSN